MANGTVLSAYGYALKRGYLFSAVYLSVQILAFALIVPFVAGLIKLAVSLSDQSALTDQDIAGFLLSPVGLIAGILVIATLLVAEVLGFALIASAQRAGGGLRQVLRASYERVVGRLTRLLVFAVLFVLRVLLIAAPFVAIAGYLYLTRLTDYDINYYLSTRPPEFLRTGALIAAGLAIGAVLLVVRLSSWVLSVHLVLFTDTPASHAFAESAARTEGMKLDIVRKIAIWLVVRALAAAVIGGVTGFVANLAPIDGGLRLALTIVLVAVMIWAISNLVLNAVSLAALARVIDRILPSTDRETEDPPHLAHPALGALVLSGLAAAGLIGGALVLDTVSPKDEVEIIAHRGGALHYPENTTAAIEHGIEAGADWIEIDVQETADGEVAVIHDSDFMKVAGVELKIWDATLADLAEIDIGERFDPAFAGERTPLLRDVLEQTRDRSKLLIELKYYGHDVALEQKVVDLVEAAGMADQIAVMSLKYPAVQKMRALRPDWRAGVLAATAIGDLVGLEGDFVAVSTVTATPRRIREADDADKAIYAWTVNDALGMSRMISRGVDGLITDDPATARKVLEVRAQLSAPERLLLSLADIIGLETVKQ